MFIRDAILEILDRGTEAKDIADTLEVSKAMISTWRNKDNDFCPRLPVAKRIYNVWDIIVYPYSKEAVDGSALLNKESM